jgi:hypothetical protein
MFGTKRVRTLLTAAGVAVVALGGTVATTTIARADVAAPSTFTFDNYPGIRVDATVNWVADGIVQVSVDSFKEASNNTWPPRMEFRAYDDNGPDAVLQDEETVPITEHNQFNLITLYADNPMSLTKDVTHVQVVVYSGPSSGRPGHADGVFVNQADCDRGVSSCPKVYP